MRSTTLMTFLLTTNSEVRSVKLLGSWDNFSKSYAMERDRRAGPGHWKGCHTFTDIMGDGPDKNQWRTGGLKMGATYWYYYLLNEDVESYSQAEPVTTKCPLLPGQPLNVLNVPIILPDSHSHSRSASSSSQKEDYRTMNPEDKYMNPRKPPKPNLARLQTSIPNPNQSSNPPSLSPSGSSLHRSASQPNSATRRNEKSKEGRSASPPRGLGLRHALTQKRPGPSPRAQAFNESLRQKAPINERRNIPGICVDSGAVSPSTSHSDNSAQSSIQTRRALKAKAGNASQARNLLTVETRPQHRKPGTYKAAASGSGSGSADGARTMHVRSGSDDMTPTGPDVSEKRLPSLPNTPSSVMDEAVRAIDERDKALDAAVLHSHFSSMTADDFTNSRFVAEHSRFSEWSTDTEDAEDTYPETTISTSSTFPIETHESQAPEEWKTPDLTSNDAATITDPNTPHLTVHSKPSSPNSASGDIPPWLPQLTISSPHLSGSGLGIDQMDEVESNPKRHAALFSALESMQALSLAQSREGSPILLSESDRRDSGTYSRRSNASSFRGKATMQEMMDELSYLKNMIQAEMDGEPF
ncbi:hypothetical protein N7507_002593 [Penicillium longicatenatum]|nr:hypothetical protein N7507_002593 [Penicillium longicatenatum]